MDKNIRAQNLLLEKFLGTISVIDEQYIDELIANNIEVKDMWEEIRSRFSTSNGINFLENVNEDNAWSRISPKLSGPKLKRFSVNKKVIGLAASLVIILSLGIYYYQKPGPQVALNKKGTIELKLANGKVIDLSSAISRTISLQSVNLNASTKALSFSEKSLTDRSWNVLEVPAKLDYHIILSDGTEVWLNSASSLKFPFSFPENKREVYLTGEAFFKVAKNAAKPFTVHSGDTKIKVLGTSFNVNSYSKNNVKTSLVEGSVHAFYRNKNIKLKPGFELTCSPEKSLDVEPFDETITLAWMKGTYFFQNTPLGDIAEIIPRWYEVNVVFDDPVLAKQPFSGAIMKSKPLKDFLDNLKTTAGLSAFYKNGAWHLK